MNDGTTDDGTITLEHAECLAACDYAPVVTVNYEFFDNQTVDSAVELVGELRAGSRPLPTRGAPLCSFKEISRQIAGFVDRPARVAARPRPPARRPRPACGSPSAGEQAPGYAPSERRLPTVPTVRPAGSRRRPSAGSAADAVRPPQRRRRTPARLGVQCPRCRR